MPIKFDTLEYTRNLIEAGFPPEQAEAQAQALNQAMAEATVSPGEMLLLRTDMIARIDMLRTETINSIDVLRTEMAGRIDMLRTETINSIDGLRTEMTGRIDVLRTEMTGRIDGLRIEISAMLGALEAQVTAQLEALRTRMRAKFTTLNWMLGLSLALHVITVAKLFS